MNVYLNDVQGHLESLASSSLNLPSWSKSTCEEFTTQFNIFKHNFQVRSSPAQQIERLYELVKKMSSYRMRKMNLRSPYENAQILTDYYLVEVCVFLIILKFVCILNFIISFFLLFSVNSLRVNCAKSLTIRIRLSGKCCRWRRIEMRLYLAFALVFTVQILILSNKSTSENLNILKLNKQSVIFKKLKLE